MPEWYQRGFIFDGAQHWLLDLSPPRQRPHGTPLPPTTLRRAPKSAFWKQDLYVTRFGEQFNDEVKIVLFQGIDDLGALAVRALLGGDAGQVHAQYQPLLSYLGAQKLRTPKGLDSIRSRYPAVSQAELPVEMQDLCHMSGALWTEAAHEVVSAEDSDVKFFIADQPVTPLNTVLTGDAAVQAYPNDAPITWNGMQTLFPLDGNHLLIQTHVHYANYPNAVVLAAKRTNVRYSGDAMMRTGRLMRGRLLAVLTGMDHQRLYGRVGIGGEQLGIVQAAVDAQQVAPMVDGSAWATGEGSAAARSCGASVAWRCVYAETAAAPSNISRGSRAIAWVRGSSELVVVAPAIFVLHAAQTPDAARQTTSPCQFIMQVRPGKSAFTRGACGLK